jgi:hypothetical protein
MKTAVLLLLAAFAAQAAPFRLDAGDNRYFQVAVTRVPTLVECRFKVLQGAPSVHLEIMSDAEYRHMSRGRDYDAIASSPTAREGEIRRMVEERGRFDVVLINDPGAPAAVVDLEVRTDVDPSEDSVARVLSPGRRLAVILISFAIFFALVTWSAWRLLRANRSSSPSASGLPDR